MLQKSKSRMLRKSITHLSIFLLLGAIVNVAVAWGCGLWSAQDTWESEVEIPIPSNWPDYLQELDWPAPYSAIRHNELSISYWLSGVTVIEIYGGDVDATFDLSGPGAEKTFVSLTVRQFGFPFRTLQWELHSVRAGPRSESIVNTANESAGLRTGFDVSDPTGAGSFGRLRQLPLLPLWPAFAINTIFYAVLLWMLFVAPFVFRRWRRKRRGLCLVCAYPIGISAVCTECGEKVLSTPGRAT